MLSINMTVCDMNYLSLDNDNEVGEIMIPAKIIGFITYLLGMLGISSILGVIHSHRFQRQFTVRFWVKHQNGLGSTLLA